MQQVKAMLAALRENYLRDLPGHIDDIEQLLLQLEREGFQLPLCQEMYRQVHTLKGSGGTYGMSFISDVCHPMEYLLSHLIEHPVAIGHGFVSAALAYIDLLRKACFSYSAQLNPGVEMQLALSQLRLHASNKAYSALLVESSEVLTSVLRDILQEAGFRIEMVNDGYVALGRVLAEHFDLLITGLEIPRLNGIALISAIQKSGGRVAKTNTVLLTTSDHLDPHVHPDFVLQKNASLKSKFRACIESTIQRATIHKLTQY